MLKVSQFIFSAHYALNKMGFNSGVDGVLCTPHKKVSLINKIKFQLKIAFSNSVTIYPGIIPIPVSYVKLNFCNSSE